MIDFMLVSEATQFPHVCIVCGGQEKPLLDLAKEHKGDHMYLCKMCARRMAQKFGFAESEELDKLMNTRQTLDAAKREIEERSIALAERDKTIRDLRTLNGELNESLSVSEQREAQLQARLDQIRQDTLATMEATK